MSALSVTDDVVKAKDVRKRNVAVRIDAVVLASVMSRAFRMSAIAHTIVNGDGFTQCQNIQLRKLAISRLYTLTG